jgi:Cytochrome P460
MHGRDSWEDEAGVTMRAADEGNHIDAHAICRLIGAGVLSSLTLFGCTGAKQELPADIEKNAAAPSDVIDIAHRFKDMDAMTKEPVFVSPDVAMLCIGVAKDHIAAEKTRSGPHAHTAISVRMNKLAADAFRNSAIEYPVGSIVVKEKQPAKYLSPSQTPRLTRARAGVGGMIKRPAGYDPDHGDWEYFYFEDPSKIESGIISSCVNCHEGARKSDYVFGMWHPGGERTSSP